MLRHEDVTISTVNYAISAVSSYEFLSNFVSYIFIECDVAIHSGKEFWSMRLIGFLFVVIAFLLKL